MTPIPGQPWTIPEMGDSGLRMSWVPPGEFIMGSAPTMGASVDEGPPTPVTLTDGFWLGVCPVTQREYAAVTGTWPSCAKTCPDLTDVDFESAEFAAAVLLGNGQERMPVEQVSWDEATEFCALLTRREREAGRLPLSHSYALPTEAQWEYACRGGTFARSFNLSGLGIRQSKGFTEARAYPVGVGKPNTLGLYDMPGTVLEWCRDAYASSLPGKRQINPCVSIDTRGERITRGLAFSHPYKTSIRYDRRDGYWPGIALDYIGFRLALVFERQ
jgi:formylglycine-generating enzyme required for sulfatase activity